MTDTTGDKPGLTRTRKSVKRRAVPWMTILIIGSVLLHIVLWFALRPLGQTRMMFDPAQEEQRTVEVREREAAREKAERERRQELALDKERAEQLKREAERQDKREMAERVAELAKVREELEAVRQETFEEIKERTTEDLIPVVWEQLEESFKTVRRQTAVVAKTDELTPGENQRLEDAAQELEQKFDEIREAREADTAAPLDVKAVKQLAQQTRQFVNELQKVRTTEGADQLRRNRATWPQATARGAAEMLDKVAEAVDIDQLNDTSTAKATPPEAAPTAEALDEMSAGELYDAAAELEQQAVNANDDIRAAELAMTNNTGFKQAQDALAQARPQRPQLAAALDAVPGTVGELNTLRDTLEQAAGQTQDMALKGQSMLAQAKGMTQSPPGGSDRYARQAAMHLASTGKRGRLVDLTNLMGGGQGDSEGMSGDDSGEGADMAASPQTNQSLKLDQDKVLAHAMPGRMFTDDSARLGWLYIDTWYVVGPWENKSQIDFEKPHPPEAGIDFDAVYTDGKFADQPDHPYHELEWKFVQADHVRVEPPKVYPASTYYAYTEVYFDHDREMLISIASDDAAKMWVNGEVVWTDFGLSSWKLGEGFRRIPFRKGFNTILVRIENGPGHCIWSVLLCPPSVAAAQ